MKKVLILVLGMLLTVGCKAQLIEVTMEIMRARRAVDSLYANDVYLEGLIDAKADKALTFNIQTGTSYTLVLSDAYKSVTMNNASASTLTIPLNSSVDFDVGTVINIHTLGAGQVTITLTGGVTGVSIDDNLAITVKGDATLIQLVNDTWKITGSLE